MINTRRIEGLLKNNSGNKGKEVLIDSFVVRIKPFQTILSAIKSNLLRVPSYLIIGQRGSGKTTLLYRLKYAIDDEIPNLIPIMLYEEQYNISELSDLWQTASDYLEEYEGFEEIGKKMQTYGNTSNLTIDGFEIINESLSRANKKLIIFIENIDVFFKKIGSDDQKSFYQLLLESNLISIIGSTTSHIDNSIIGNSPFSHFFETVNLEGLTKKESIKLLLKFGDLTNEESQIREIVRKKPSRIESLRRLTAGNPRTIAYLFQIFLDNENGKAIVDLYKLLDDLTFLYKAELDHLSSQQQKIIDIIAKNWDAIAAKDIASKTKIDSKQVSSVLNSLEKNQVVESINTSTKNKLYRLKDRFLNIWYLMRFGRKKDQENVIWLVRFYDAWCDTSELSRRIANHIDNLKMGQYDYTAAVDMGNTFLSCQNVSPSLKYNLYKTTVSHLPRNLISQLKLSSTLFYDTIKELIQKKEYQKALEEIQDVPTKDPVYYLITHYIHFKLKNYSLSAKEYEMYYELKNDSEVAYRIGDFYAKYLYDNKKSLKYFELALNKGYYKAAYRLGILYEKMENIELAIKYHKLAIENNITDSLLALAGLFYHQKEYDKSEQFTLEAIDKKNISAYTNLAWIEESKGNIGRAVEILEESINYGNVNAYISLGMLFLYNKNLDKEKVKYYFDKAVENSYPKSYSIVGKYYLKNKSTKSKGLKILQQGVQNEDPDAAHILAHQKVKDNKWEEAEELFLKSIEWGRLPSLLCLSTSAFYKGKNDRKASILSVFERYIHELEDYPIAQIEYSKILLWNGNVHESINNIVQYEPVIINLLEQVSEDFKEAVLGELTEYFLYLIARGEYIFALNLFNSSAVDYKNVLKPVYYSLMHFMRDEFPNEYLKVGQEISETVNELIEKINHLKKNNTT